jgi:hypothetical protein
MRAMHTMSLYMLVDPTGGPKCYIGASNDPERRLRDHYSDADVPQSEVSWAERDAIAMCRAIRGDACLNMRAR